MMPLVCLSCPVLRSAMPTSQRLSVYDHVLQKKKSEKHGIIFMNYKIHPVQSHFLFWYDAVRLMHKDAAGVRIQVRLIKSVSSFHGH